MPITGHSKSFLRKLGDNRSGNQLHVKDRSIAGSVNRFVPAFGSETGALRSQLVLLANVTERKLLKKTWRHHHPVPQVLQRVSIHHSFCPFCLLTTLEPIYSSVSSQPQYSVFFINLVHHSISSYRQYRFHVVSIFLTIIFLAAQFAKADCTFNEQFDAHHAIDGCGDLFMWA